MTIDEEIIGFLRSNIVATICCNDNGVPWCFNCFYALMEHEGIMIFKSGVESAHSAMLDHNHKVAGTVLPATINFAGLQGIQFDGMVLACNKYFLQEATNIYEQKFPMGVNMPGKIWAVELNKVKLTDNTKGFGYKNTWQRDLVTVPV